MEDDEVEKTVKGSEKITGIQDLLVFNTRLGSLHTLAQLMLQHFTYFSTTLPLPF